MKIPAKATMQLVEVEWFDSASTAGWCDSAELAAEFDGQADGGLARCRSVGYLWRVSPRDIVLALNQQRSKVRPFGVWRVGQMMSIARSTIINVSVVKIVRARPLRKRTTRTRRTVR